MADKGTLNIQTLPSEILENVARYLDDISVLKWSSTSNHMRDSLNQDWIWKRYCIFDEEVYDSWGKPQVRPIFGCASSHEIVLSSFCKWKTNYMMQAHLMKNWTQGVFKLEDEIEIEPNNVICGTGKVIFASKLFGNVLFLKIVELCTMEAVMKIVNIQQSPFSNSTHEFVGFTSGENLDQVNTAQVKVSFTDHGNRVAVSICEVCLIYEINLSVPSMQLRHALLFGNSKTFDDPFEVVSFAMSNGYGRNSPTVITTKYFIGAKKCTGNSYEVHFWDIRKGEKLDVVKISPDNDSSTVQGLEFVCARNEEHLIIRLILKNNRHSNLYFGFDLKKFEFTSFRVRVNYCSFVLLDKDRAVGLGPRQLYLYNYETSERIVKKDYSLDILLKTVVVVGDVLVYGLVDSTLFLVDIFTGIVTNKIKLNFTLYSLRPLTGKFVVVNSINSVVMEIGKNVKTLFKLPVDTTFKAINKSGTKMAVSRRNQVIIMNFW